MNLTREQKSRIFSRHIGCDVVFPSDQELKGYLTGYSGYDQLEIQHHDGTHADEESTIWQIEEVLMCLSPISELTEEDALAVVKIASWHPDIADDYQNIVSDIRIDSILRHVLVDENGNKRCLIEIPHTCICYEGSLFIDAWGNVYFQENDDSPKEYAPHSNLVNQYLSAKGYATSEYIDLNHPDNGKNAIEIGLAIGKLK